MLTLPVLMGARVWKKKKEPATAAFAQWALRDLTVKKKKTDAPTIPVLTVGNALFWASCVCVAVVLASLVRNVK